MPHSIPFFASRRSDTGSAAAFEAAEALAGVGHWRFDLASQQLAWSPQLYRLLGSEPEAEKPRFEAMQPLFGAETTAGVVRLIESVAASNAPRSFECTLRRADGTVIDLLSRLAPAFAGGGVGAVHGVVQDIGEFAHRLRENRTDAAEYRRLADNSADVIARIGLDGMMRYVSPSVEAMFGYTPAQMVDLPSADFVYPEDLPLTAALFERLRAGETEARLQHRVLHRDGHVLWVETRTRVVAGDDGAAHEIVTVARDISETKALEAELRQAREDAEAAGRAKEDFLANMSHELRTPLNSLVGFSALIAEAPELCSETRRRAELVSGASRSLVAIVNDILDLSKIQAEGVSLVPEPVQVEDILISAIALVRDQANQVGVGLSLEISRPSRAVMLDPARVRQVLFNLLGNALKFTPRGGRVTLLLDEDRAGLIRVGVRDTGVGIPADRLGKIFERFAQADSTTSRRYGGTGLGLTISRSIVEAMGGAIAVESLVGSGSTFSFTFQAPSAPPRDAPPRGEEVEAPRLASPRRLLLADDNDINRDLFRALTAGRNLEIEEASDGCTAVELVKSSHFDLVLMDVQMPVMDGISAARAIRAAGFAELPIIALTANVMQPQIDLCLAAGMNGHLGKPFGARELAEVIERWAPAGGARRLDTPCVLSTAVLDDLRDALGETGVLRFLEKLALQLRVIAPQLEVPPGDTAELGRCAHRVRGLAANLGFIALDAAFARLEQADGAALDLAALDDARRATRDALHEIARRAPHEAGLHREQHPEDGGHLAVS